MNTTKYILFTLYFLLPTLMFAQTLEELLKESFDNNSELKVLENEYKAALELAPQVSELPDPKLGVGIFPLPVETRLGAQLARVSISQNIPWMGVLEGRANLKNSKAKALFERIGARHLDLNYRIKLAYFQLYEIQESISITKRNISILETLEQIALVKVEIGKSSIADVLRVQLRITELKQELQILETDKVFPISTINQILNLPLDNLIVAKDKLLFASITLNKDTLLSDIKDNSPILRMFELQQEVSRQAIVLNSLDAKPSFGLGADYILVSKRKDADLMYSGRDIFQVKATLRIPIYKKKYGAKEREENLKITALDYKKENVYSMFASSIEKAFASYKSAQLKMKLYQDQKEITKSLIDILQTKYSANGNNFEDLLGLEKDMVDYDFKLLKVIILSHIAKAKIESMLLGGI